MADLSDVVICAEKFERLIAEFYSVLSKKVEDKLLSAIFKWISAESFNHAELMSSIHKTLDLQHVEVDCSAVIGESWVAAIKSMQNVMKIDKVDSRVVSELLADMKVLENFTGEETYGKLLYPLVRNLIIEVGEESKDLRMMSDMLSTVLDEIVLEEKYHEKLVNLISDLLQKYREF